MLQRYGNRFQGCDGQQKGSSKMRLLSIWQKVKNKLALSYNNSIAHSQTPTALSLFTFVWKLIFFQEAHVLLTWQQPNHEIHEIQIILVRKALLWGLEASCNRGIFFFCKIYICPSLESNQTFKFHLEIINIYLYIYNQNY